MKTKEEQKATPTPTNKTTAPTRKKTSSQRVAMANKTPYRTCPHLFFIAYSGLAFISAILLGLAQLIGLSLKEVEEIPSELTVDNIPDEISEIERYFLAILLVIMCFNAALTELEWCDCLINSRILRFWVTRGILYVSIAFLSLYQLRSSTDKTSDQRQFIEGISYVFGGVGAGYTVMGILCLQIVLGRIRLDYRAKKYGYKTSRNPETPSDLSFDSEERVVV
jgi:hypothetical protein